jgi:hypothetical protein
MSTHSSLMSSWTDSLTFSLFPRGRHRQLLRSLVLGCLGSGRASKHFLLQLVHLERRRINYGNCISALLTLVYGVL